MENPKINERPSLFKQETRLGVHFNWGKLMSHLQELQLHLSIWRNQAKFIRKIFEKPNVLRTHPE
jgi:hypothetical protein